MKVYVLAENTAVSDAFGCEHGLSLLLETATHGLLFDTGASGLFAENAQKLGVDLAQVDLAVLSHGHYDHGGGLHTFLSCNAHAKIYAHKRAFEKHYASRLHGQIADIGLDAALLPNEQFVFCDDQTYIDDALTLFAGVQGDRLLPSGNHSLFMMENNALVVDDFSHEQNLIVHENGKTLLIAGCAHNGIVNILEHFHAMTGVFPDAVIGGFHLYSHGLKRSEDPALVTEIGKFLLHTKAQYYTCHCTGTEAFAGLQAVMGDHIRYLSSGDSCTIFA